MGESCPGATPWRASRNSGRKSAGFIRPIKPPESAVGSMDFSLASVEKSYPALSFSSAWLACSGVRTTITLKATSFGLPVAVGGADCPYKSAQRSPEPQSASPSTQPFVLRIVPRFRRARNPPPRAMQRLYASEPLVLNHFARNEIVPVFLTPVVRARVVGRVLAGGGVQV